MNFRPIFGHSSNSLRLLIITLIIKNNPLATTTLPCTSALTRIHRGRVLAQLEGLRVEVEGVVEGADELVVEGWAPLPIPEHFHQRPTTPLQRPHTPLSACIPRPQIPVIATPLRKPNALAPRHLPLKSIYRLSGVYLQVGVVALVHARQVLGLAVAEAVDKIRLLAEGVECLVHILVGRVTVDSSVFGSFFAKGGREAHKTLLVYAILIPTNIFCEATLSVSRSCKLIRLLHVTVNQKGL